jgi:hypothetical protein
LPLKKIKFERIPIQQRLKRPVCKKNSPFYC